MKNVSTIAAAFVFSVCAFTAFAAGVHKSVGTPTGLSTEQEEDIRKAVKIVKDQHLTAIVSGLKELQRNGKLDGNLESWKKTAVAVSAVESSGKQRAVSSKGAIGLMQIKYATAKDVCDVASRAHLFHPKTNTKCGVSYVRQIQANAADNGIKSLNQVFYAYNHGEEGARQHLEALRSYLSEADIERRICRDPYVKLVRFAIRLQNSQV